MNIFVLDLEPKKCAKYHCDKHVVKMILETAQLLCGAVWISGQEAPYKLTHKNHPCAIWTRESIWNWLWLYNLGMDLCEEYTKRYKKEHKTQSVIESLSSPNLPNIERTPFALAMPNDCKISYIYTNDSVASYRKYYKKYKRDIAKWNYCEKPWWWD